MHISWFHTMPGNTIVKTFSHSHSTLFQNPIHPDYLKPDLLWTKYRNQGEGNLTLQDVRTIVELSLNKCCKQLFVREYYLVSVLLPEKRENYILNHWLYNIMERNSLNVPTDTHGLIHETISSYLLGYLLTPHYKSFWRFHKGLANHRNEEKTFI